MLFDCEIRSSIEVEARCAKQSSHQVIGIDMSFQRHIQNTRAIWPIFHKLLQVFPPSFRSSMPSHDPTLHQLTSTAPSTAHSTLQVPLHSKQLNMSFQRVGLRFAQQLRASATRPTLRSTLQRRHLSAPAPPGQGGSKLSGAADNAFNRERAAVKAHAAATSGELCSKTAASGGS